MLANEEAVSLGASGGWVDPNGGPCSDGWDMFAISTEIDTVPLLVEHRQLCTFIV